MDETAPQKIDTSRPHPARIYDYYLGGKNHFAADRETADKVLKSWPSIRVGAREQRGFLGRAVRYLAAEAGIRQFLDIGAGLPSSTAVHEIAQSVQPSCRVVYVDNDPLVLMHARALLTSAPQGRTAYVRADLRDPARILADPVTRAVLDLREPAALILVGILHFLRDEDGPGQIVATLLDALPPGSYLVASHVTAEHNQAGVGAAVSTFRGAGLTGQPRDSGELEALAFRDLGLRLVPPGVVLVSQWRPEGTGPLPTPAEVNCYGAVGIKP